MPEELSVRERGKQDRRDRIIEAARDIIATQGLGGVSTRKIAEHAGLSVHTLYSLIGNRQAVLTAVMRENHDLISAEMNAISDADPIAEVLHVIDSTCQLHKHDSRQKAMMLALSTMQQKGEASKEMDEVLTEGLQRFVVPLNRAREQGVIRDDLAVEALGMSLNAVFNSLLLGYLIDKIDLQGFATMSRYSFWLQLSAAATADFRDEFLANAMKQSAQAGF